MCIKLYVQTQRDDLTHLDASEFLRAMFLDLVVAQHTKHNDCKQETAAENTHPTKPSVLAVAFMDISNVQWLRILIKSKKLLVLVMVELTTTPQ